MSIIGRIVISKIAEFSTITSPNNTMKTTKLEKLSDIELIKRYSEINSLLRERKILKSKNLVSDVGKHYAIDFYNNNADLPNLQPIESGVRNINAISKQGERYCIKSTTKALTGLFYGLNDPESQQPEIQKFEYVVIVLLNEDFGLKRIMELSWQQFLEFKSWNKANKAWSISVTKKVLDIGRMVFVA